MKEWFKKQMSCEKRGHLWQPVFISARYNMKDIRFIACRCERCGKGADEIHNIIDAGENREYGTFTEMF